MFNLIQKFKYHKLIYNSLALLIEEATDHELNRMDSDRYRLVFNVPEEGNNTQEIQDGGIRFGRLGTTEPSPMNDREDQIVMDIFLNYGHKIRINPFYDLPFIFNMLLKRKVKKKISKYSDRFIQRQGNKIINATEEYLENN